MRILTAFTLLLVLSAAVHAGPLDKLREAAGGSETMPRRPNDNIEGTVWEYKAEFTGRVPDGQEKPETLAGRFRTEGEAVFDVGRRLQMPDLPQGGPRSVLDKLKEAPPSEVKLPTTQVKRIGEYRFSKEKLIIQFDDPKSLHGTMVLRQKKRTKNVWHGDYSEKEGKKTVRKWSVEVRKIED